MAAAVRREDTDGKGWGLEVCVSLKEVNPEGKSEFSGRREFEEMLARGRGLASTVPSPRRIVPDTRTAVRINGSSSSFPSQVHAGPSNLHPTTAIRAPTPQHFAHPSSTASHRSSLPSPNPPSSTPMASSTSYPKIPSRPPSADQRSTLVPVPSSTSAALRPSTPPPPPQRKSPPPSTPSRATLHALLRSDGKMSPGLAQTLANNPMLLRLLKAVPPSAGPLSSLSETKASPAPDTPTPSTSTTVKLRTEGCDNCGTLESDLWRTKTSKDGTKKKVCNGGTSSNHE